MALKDINDIKNANFAEIPLKKEATANSQFYELTSEDGNLQLQVVQEVITRDKSEYKGFVYHVPQFLSIGTLLAFFNEEQVLSLINAKVATMVATRATNRIDREVSDKIGDKREGETDEQYNQRRATAIAERLITNPVAFTPNEAVNYVPGERELSLPSILAKINKLHKTASEYLKAGDMASAISLFDTIKQLTGVLNEMTAKMRQNAEAAPAE